MDTREFLDQLPDRNLQIRGEIRDLMGRRTAIDAELATLEDELQLSAELRVFDQRRAEKLVQKAKTADKRARQPRRAKKIRTTERRTMGGLVRQVTRLSAAQKREIRASTEDARAIATRMLVTPTTIWRIRRDPRPGPVAVKSQSG